MLIETGRYEEGACLQDQCKTRERGKKNTTGQSKSEQTHVIREEVAIPSRSERNGLRRTGRTNCAATLPQPAHMR
jgi:hypothetical protein